MRELDSWRVTGRRALRVARQRGWWGPGGALSGTPGSTPAVALLFAVPAAVFGLLLALALAGSWFSFLGQGPKDDRPPEEYFKYGSIGNEATDGLPYLVWLVLPEVFPEYLPGSGAGARGGAGGYAAFGFAYEAGRESPIGFSVKTVGFPRIAINCAVCHSGTFRTAPDAPPTIVPTAPAVRMDSRPTCASSSARRGPPLYGRRPAAGDRGPPGGPPEPHRPRPLPPPDHPPHSQRPAQAEGALRLDNRAPGGGRAGSTPSTR